MTGEDTEPRVWSKDFFKTKYSDFVLGRFEGMEPVGPVVIYMRDGVRVETAYKSDSNGLGAVTFTDGSRFAGQIDSYGRPNGMGALYSKTGALERAGKWSSGSPVP